MGTDPTQAVVVVADDLIWASRLVAATERAGRAVLRAHSVEGLGRALAAEDVEGRAARDDIGVSPPGKPRITGVLVDLNGRRYDGVEAVALAAGSGSPVIAVGQHEDLELRKRALAAGARRVFSYDKFFRDGPALVAEWFVDAAAGARR